MKLTVLSLEYPPNIYGGVGVHVWNMAAALSRFMEVEVRTKATAGPRATECRLGKEDSRKLERSSGDGRRETGDGLRTTKIAASDTRRHAITVRRYRLPSPVSRLPSPDFQPALEALALDLEMVSDPMDCDIVHSHTWYMNMAGALAKKLYGIPAVATVHSLEPLRPWKAEQLGRGYELSKWMEREGLCACDRVIAVSAGMKKDIMSCYPIPPSRISVVHNGIDPAIYARREDMRVLGRYGIRKPYVLFVGRLTRQKGVFDLLEASKSFAKGTQLVLATGRPDEPRILDDLKKAVKGRRDVVWINTMLGRAETIALYSGAAVSVTPSVYEPFGIVVVEAMACGSPVVASSVGGIREIVQNGRSGILVRPADPSSLAEAVNRLLGDRALRMRLASNARKRVLEHFTWESAARRTLEIYKSLL
jgi:glycogen synthase